MTRSGKFTPKPIEVDIDDRHGVVKLKDHIVHQSYTYVTVMALKDRSYGKIHIRTEVTPAMVTKIIAESNSLNGKQSNAYNALQKSLGFKPEKNNKHADVLSAIKNP
jgi:hypothetical protein